MSPIDTTTTPQTPAKFIEAPQHPQLRMLLQYWAGKCGLRSMPTRTDINPADIPALLPNLMIWSVESSGDPYVIRLVGDNIVKFNGINYTGQSAIAGMPPDAAATMLDILGQVTASRRPRFRIGKAWWTPRQVYRDFEACFLPLSSDGAHVDKILGGVVFDFISLPD